MMGTDEAMMERLRAAGERSAERVWPLPLFAEYSKQIIAILPTSKTRPVDAMPGQSLGLPF
jgi:leucyl aminopeptidase